MKQYTKHKPRGHHKHKAHRSITTATNQQQRRSIERPSSPIARATHRHELSASYKHTNRPSTSHKARAIEQRRAIEQKRQHEPTARATHRHEPSNEPSKDDDEPSNQRRRHHEPNSLELVRAPHHGTSLSKRSTARAPKRIDRTTNDGTK